jgi:hypothetical protein
MQNHEVVISTLHQILKDAISARGATPGSPEGASTPNSTAATQGQLGAKDGGRTSSTSVLFGNAGRRSSLETGALNAGGGWVPSCRRVSGFIQCAIISIVKTVFAITLPKD